MRWLGLLLFAACAHHAGPEIDEHVTVVDVGVWVPHRVDLLLVIDDSSAMTAYQAELAMAIGELANQVETMGRWDLHIGVAAAGDGILRAASSIDQAFIIRSPRPDGSLLRNYSGTLADSWRAIADVGVASVAPQEPLDAIVHVLGDDAGFARENALFYPIVITAHDDPHADIAPYVALLRARADVALSLVASAAPRLSEFVASFPNRWISVPIDGDWAAALGNPWPLLSPPILDPCIAETLRQPYDCAVSDILDADEHELPPCDSSRPCWKIVADSDPGCATNLKLHIDRDEFPADGTHVVAQCVVSP